MEHLWNHQAIKKWSCLKRHLVVGHLGLGIGSLISSQHWCIYVVSRQRCLGESLVYPQASISIRYLLQPFPLLAHTWLWNQNPEIWVITGTSSRFFMDICSSDLCSLSIMKYLPTHMFRNILHWRYRWVVPFHCLHRVALWVWVLWMQRWLDHHPRQVQLLVLWQVHQLGLSLVSSCWSA